MMMKRILMAVVVAATLTVGGPGLEGARAAGTNVTDPVGDGRLGKWGDLTKVIVRHSKWNVQVEVRARKLPPFLHFYFDLPGGWKTWDEFSSWVRGSAGGDVYTHWALENRGEPHCRSKSASMNDERSVMTITFARSCLRSPDEIRVRVTAESSDPYSTRDTARWTPWAERA